MSSSQNDFDISKIPNEDLEGLSTAIEDFYKKDTSVKIQLSYAWERNHLFLDGKQWIVYDGQKETGGIWRPLTVNRENEYIPRPVTNYLYDGYQTLKSYVIKNKPRSKVFPNTDSWNDKEAAKLATLCCEANWERLKEQDNYEVAATNLLAYGTVFKKDYWDNTSLMLARVPKMESVPETDVQTGAPTGKTVEKPVIDPATGDQVYEELPLGDVNTAVVEPYRMAIDPLAMSLHKARWIMESSIQPLDWIRGMYDKDPEQNPGYTGLISEVKEENELNSSLRRFADLKNSSGIKNTIGGVGAGGGTTLEGCAVVKEVYIEPTAEYPHGRLVVVANGITLYAGESPYRGTELGDWHPYSECRWELMPGRFHGKSCVDDAIELQKQINSIDAIIILTRKTMAIPQRGVFSDNGISPGSWTGRPGQQISIRAGTTPPIVFPAAGVDSQVFTERAQKVNDLKQIMGATDILKGEAPSDVTAASALNLLYEVGTGKIFPALDRWKAFVESSQKKQLKLIAHKYKESRPDFVALLMSKNKDLSAESIENFLGADLNDNCNVVVEAGSNIPKLKAAEQSMLMELAQTGALGLDNPNNRVEFHSQLGIRGFDSDVGPDNRRAGWENSLLDNVGSSPNAMQPVVLDVDNDDIHIHCHSNRMKEPSWMYLPIQVQQAYMQHLQAHEQSKAMKAQAQMLQQMAMQPGGAPGPGPQGPAGPPAKHPMAPGAPNEALKGTQTKEVRNAVRGDLLTPATLGQGSRT